MKNLHIMFDIETTGGDPNKDNMIQLAAQPFSMDGSLTFKPFDQCLCLLPNRKWNDDTYDWWHDTPEKIEVLETIFDMMKPARKTMKAFVNWVEAFQVDNPTSKIWYWANPPMFDIAFIRSYCILYDLPCPIKYPRTLSCKSVIYGCKGVGFKIEKSSVTTHDALQDCRDQILTLKKYCGAIL